MLSGVMMFRHLGWHEAADLIEQGIGASITQKRVTYDLARQMHGATELKTSQFAEAIVENMQAADGHFYYREMAGDFVARGQRVLLRAPVAADGVDVGVADAGELDVDQDVVRANIPALDGGRNEGVRRGRGGVSVNGKHGSPACGWCGGCPGVRHRSGAAFRPGRHRGLYPSNTTRLPAREALL